MHNLDRILLLRFLFILLFICRRRLVRPIFKLRIKLDLKYEFYLRSDHTSSLVISEVFMDRNASHKFVKI